MGTGGSDAHWRPRTRIRRTRRQEVETWACRFSACRLPSPPEARPCAAGWTQILGKGESNIEQRHGAPNSAPLGHEEKAQDAESWGSAPE